MIQSNIFNKLTLDYNRNVYHILITNLISFVLLLLFYGKIGSFELECNMGIHWTTYINLFLLILVKIILSNKIKVKSNNKLYNY